jgi:hypothetical protein
VEIGVYHVATHRAGSDGYVFGRLRGQIAVYHDRRLYLFSKPPLAGALEIRSAIFQVWQIAHETVRISGRYPCYSIETGNQVMRETVKQILSAVPNATSPKLVANNTVRYQRGEDTVWRLHQTDIVTKHADGSWTLTSGGWRSPTTKGRLIDYGPLQIWSDKGEWFTNAGPFFDGMKVYADGTVSAPPAGLFKRRADLRKKINKFCSAVPRKPPMPDSGDCLTCAADLDSCLESHIDEGYIHARLLVRALSFQGYQDPMFILRNGSIIRIRRALRDFLISKLLDPKPGSTFNARGY